MEQEGKSDENGSSTTARILHPFQILGGGGKGLIMTFTDTEECVTST